MLNIETSFKNGICYVTIAGAVNESSTVNFDYGSAREVHVDCAKIGRLNSMGVRIWSASFEKLRAEKIKLRFSKLSVPLISQCNFVIGLIAADEVESLSVPYFCETCTKEFTQVRDAAELRREHFQVPPVPCIYCKAMAEFDGSPVTYFTFMT